MLLWPALVFAAPAADGQPQTNLTCIVCGKSPLVGKVWLHKAGHVCDECYQLPTRCSLCGLPARENFTRTSDGRIICQRDAKDALLSGPEAVRLFDATRAEIKRVIGEVMSLRGTNVAVSLFDIDYWNHQDGKPVAREMRRMGFSQSRREGDDFRHSVILLSGQPKTDGHGVCAHEYAHLWLNENLPEKRALEADTLEAVCEIVAYHLAVARQDAAQQDKIRDNPYTHGRIRTMIDARSKFGLHAILTWVKTGSSPTVNFEELSRMTAGYAQATQAKAPVPDTLQLKGLVITSQRRFATINGRSFEPGKEHLVPVGDKNVRVRCLEIREDAVVIRVEGSTEPQTLRLERK